jgi:hypothetical protein
MPHDYPIDLGKGMNNGPVEIMPSPRKEKYYPCLFLDWDEKYELPESGHMHVSFRKKSETNREDDRGTHQSVELEIREILDVEADKKSKKERSGSEALDEYKKEVE